MKVCALCERCYDDSVVSCTEESHPVLSETCKGDPEMIADYRLDFLLESGVRGETYRARQIESGRSCLIKILSAPEINNEQFLRDASVAAPFFHPNVVDVFEAGTLESGEFYIVAEDADGKPLRGFLDSVGVPELLTSIEVVRQTAEALHALHREGLVHHAINPENILLTTDAEDRLLVRIKDLDFGGVVGRSIVSNKFLIDSALDSLRYFAPEQCSGGEVTAQTDVYSLGVVFYEMLAGTPPFDATKAAVLIEKHKSERPPDVKVNNFELRMLVTHALMESLQKQPEMRQASANTLARQLRHIQQLATHVSTPPPAGVVPHLPVRSAPRDDVFVEPVRPVIEPVVIAETAPVMIREDIQPVAARVEPGPIAALKTESESVQAEASASIAKPVIIRERVLAELVVQKVAPAIEIAVPKTPVLARLRLAGLKLGNKISSLLATAHAPGIDQGVAVAASIKPTRIEWVQPEDDIPSVADVLKVRASEQVEEISVIQVEPEIAVNVEPAKIKLPSLREERGLASAGGWFSPTSLEEIDTIPANAELAEIETEIPAGPEPAKIESTEPESDMTIIEVRPTVQKTTIPIGHMRLEDVSVIPKIKSEQTYARIPWVKGVLKTPSNKEAISVPVVRDELEEITLVRARKPIRIDLDRPEPSPGVRRDKMFSFDAPDAVRFVPTLLGDSEKRRSIDLDAKDAIFSSYDGQTTPRTRVRRRLLAAGGVTALLIVGFLFADDLGRYLEAASSGDSVAVKTNPTEATAALKSSVPSAKKKSANTSGTMVSEAESKPSVTKERSPGTGTSRLSEKEEVVKTPATSKKKSTAEPQKSHVDKKPASVPNKTGGTTRPRVVADPRP